ncbi:hypothetical protein [Rhizobium sp. R635]|uniref:hypothetical protein n=1 Tax=Rhizobium sp. R635 TaxID=1764275 RepID=UPI0011301454|nr:hypothetical protein [Rhizobium sp. R635]
MKTFFVLVSSAALVTSCGTDGTFLPRRMYIKQTAAVDALGPGAISTSLVRATTIQPGRIYHQAADGSIHPICQKDFEKQNALKAMPVKEEKRPGDIAEDTVYQASVSLPLGLGKARFPYDRVKVTGFTVTSIDGVDNVPSYILSNLASKCKTETLKNNRPYYVTSAVAVADKAETYSRSAVDSVSVGPFTYEGGEETKGPTRSNVVFAATARRVSKEP